MMPEKSENRLTKRQRIGRVWATIWRALVKYTETDGEQRAASFAYYALFALLPLTVLLITLSTRFLGDQTKATQVVFNLMADYLIKMDASTQASVQETVKSFMASRLGSGLISIAIVLWCSLRFFQSLVTGVNKAWGTKEYDWWRLPLMNLLMVTVLASALLLGIIAPTAINAVDQYYQDHQSQFGFDHGLGRQALNLARSLLPPLLLFYALTLFYKFAPRRKTTFREVWLEAIAVTLLLGGLQKLFLFYASKIAEFNLVFGTFGSVVALLMWIYLTGATIILGGCFCAARAEITRGLEDQAISEHAK